MDRVAVLVAQRRPVWCSSPCTNTSEGDVRRDSLTDAQEDGGTGLALEETSGEFESPRDPGRMRSVGRVAASENADGVVVVTRCSPSGELQLGHGAAPRAESSLRGICPSGRPGA